MKNIDKLRKDIIDTLDEITLRFSHINSDGELEEFTREPTAGEAMSVASEMFRLHSEFIQHEMSMQGLKYTGYLIVVATVNPLNDEREFSSFCIGLRDTRDLMIESAKRLSNESPL